MSSVNSASSSTERPLQAQMPKLPSTAKGASPTAHVQANALVPIERVTREVNPKFVERQKKELVQRLTLVLTSPQMLPPLITLISEYAVSALTAPNPLRLHLRSENSFKFAGFNVGPIASGENALFLTRVSNHQSPGFHLSTAHSQLIRIEEEGESFVSRVWNMPYNDRYGNVSPLHTVQTGEGNFCFQTHNTIEWMRESVRGSSSLLRDRSDTGRKVAWVVVYDPSSQRIWRERYDNDNKNLVLVGSTANSSKEIVCAPKGNPRYSAEILFASIVSPSRIVLVCDTVIGLFSTVDVDRDGHCRELHGHQLEHFFASHRTTEIPRSTRFIAALDNNSITYFNADLAQDRLVFPRDAVPMATNVNWTPSVAANSAAAAIVQELSTESRNGYWDCGVSLLDHESAQEISHFNFSQNNNEGFSMNSWLTENNVLIMSNNARGRAVNSLSLIDFRESGAKKVVL